MTNPNSGSHIQNPDDSASKIVEALRQCLMEERPSGKTPRGLDKALDALPQSFLNDRVCRAFLSKGFKAWYAYFLTSEHIKEITVLLSDPALEQVVADVSQLDANESVNKRIQHILFSSDRSAKRCRILNSINVELPSPPDASRMYSELHLPPAKRPRSEGVQQSQHSNPENLSGEPAVHLDDNSAESSSHGSERFNAATEIGDPGIAKEWQAFKVDPRYQYAWPKARNLPFVFPHYMCTAIVKTDDAASVLLSFPSNPAQCRFIFDISSKEIQHIAKELFGVHVQIVRARQCIVLEHGVTVDIKGSVKLRGASNVAIDKLFGQMVGAAFRHSPQRMDELSNGEILSNSSTMKIWEAERSPGRLNFKVEAHNLSTIWHGLWQDTSPSYPAGVMPSS
ncbi:hypothetical protein F4808DRAFT_446519 [Astrocystis sublimbata]|nr:hypothetical protein F4808DRAFT_446519 [Astrocystis sublimbata]